MPLIPVAVARPSQPLLPALLLGALLLLAAIWPQPARALSCTVTIGDVAFGSIDLLTAADPVATTSSAVTLTCSRALLEVVPILTGGAVTACVFIGDPGNTKTPTAAQRFMRGGFGNADYLGYQLYKDPARTQIWGTSTYGAGARQFNLNVAGLGGSTTINTSIYGTVQGGQQQVSSGSYSQTHNFSAADVSLRWAEGSNVACSPTMPGVLNSSATTFKVSATAIHKCSIGVSNSTLDFGTSPATIAAPIDAQIDLSMICTKQTAWNIGLSVGNGSGATATDRKMTGPGGATAAYNLYVDAARTKPWPVTCSPVFGNASCPAIQRGTAATQIMPVFGRVPAQTVQTAGTYTDTIIATVVF